MDGDEDPGPTGVGPPPGKRKLSKINPTEDNNAGDDDLYKPFLKTGYKRIYPENSNTQVFQVFVENANPKEKIGNKSPIYLNHIFSVDIKGIQRMHRVTATKISVVFKQYNYANNFLLNVNFLEKYNLKAYIPAKEIEKIGIIRYVPTNISNKELYSKLSSKYDIISIRRFTKKIGNERVALQTVSITFLSNILPESVQYDLFSYRVFEYVPPLLRCFKCFKFNHSAKICNGIQKCSICAGDHLYKECENSNSLNCINCGGPHLAISRTCPIKIKKIIEKRNKITYVDKTKSIINEKEFPHLKTKMDTNLYKNVSNVNNSVNIVNKPQSKPSLDKPDTTIEQNKKVELEQIANNEIILNAIVKSLIHLANSGNEAITINKIKEVFLSKLF